LAVLTRLLCVALLAVVVTGEAVLRLFYHEQLKLRKMPLVYVPDPLLGYRYKPGARSEICIPDICRPVHINANGFHGAPFSLQRATGVFRIALVADSQGTGIWLNHGESYVSQAEAMLRQRGHHVEILNFSMDGRHRDLENVELVRTEVRRYRPDLVLLELTVPFVATHIQRTTYRDYVVHFAADVEGSLEDAARTIDAMESRRGLILLYRTSFIVRALARSYALHSDSWRALYLEAFISRRFPDLSSPVPLSLKRTAQIMATLRDTLARDGTELVLMGSVSDGDLRALAAADQIELYPLRIPTEPGLTYAHDIHLNELGQKAMAEQIAAALDRRLRTLRTSD
jgi:hypothetical protein